MIDSTSCRHCDEIRPPTPQAEQAPRDLVLFHAGPTGDVFADEVCADALDDIGASIGNAAQGACAATWFAYRVGRSLCLALDFKGAEAKLSLTILETGMLKLPLKDEIEIDREAVFEVPDAIDALHLMFYLGSFVHACSLVPLSALSGPCTMDSSRR